MPYTLSYDEKVNGWVSFFSYYPEMMVNLNNDLFSFSGGQLYIHNQDTSSRNSFYGNPSAPTVIDTILNDSPSEIKIFKTVEIEGDGSLWDVEVTTDLDRGHVLKESFKNKEGILYEYIKRNEEDILNTKNLSIQGIGELSLLFGNTFVFSTVPSNINVGDKLFFDLNGTPTQAGVVSSLGQDNIVVSSVLNIPSAGSFMFVAKSPVAESTGLKGYYASVRLTNNDSDDVELFAINSEVVKSFP